MDEEFDPFDISFIDEDGNLNRMRSFKTPQDFIKESLRNKDQANKCERMAKKREEKFGIDDKQAAELRWTAHMLRDHAENNQMMADLVKKD